MFLSLTYHLVIWKPGQLLLGLKKIKYIGYKEMIQHHCTGIFLAYHIECPQIFWQLGSLSFPDSLDGKDCASYHHVHSTGSSTVLGTQYCSGHLGHLWSLLPLSLHPTVFFCNQDTSAWGLSCIDSCSSVCTYGSGFHFLKNMCLRPLLSCLLLLRVLSSIWKGAWQELL